MVASSVIATAELARRGGRRRDRGSNNAKKPRHSEAATTFVEWLFAIFRDWIFILIFKNV
jgi:hypothetical protein